MGAKWGRKSQVAHKWSDWPHNPCPPGGTQSFKVEDKIRSGPKVGRLGYITPTVYKLPITSKPGQNQNWPKSGRFG